MSAGNGVNIGDILNQLRTNTEFFEATSTGLSRIDPRSNGRFAISSRVGGFFAHETAEHELLHLAQFLRDPALAIRAISFTWAQRQPYEVVPTLIGSPVLLFGSLSGGVAIGGGTWYVLSNN